MQFGRFAVSDRKGLIGLTAALALCAVAFSGCGAAKPPKVIEYPTVSVDGGGRISVWFVGNFAEEYYSVSELTDMAREEAEAYNAADGGQEPSVTVEKVELLPNHGDKVVVNYLFDGWRSCADFNGTALFYGTVEEALREGFDGDVALESVSDRTFLSEEQYRGQTDRYVIITDVKADIYCPARVTHLSGGARLNEDGSVNTAASDGRVYILLK